MITLQDTDHDFVCDIQAPCFQSLSSDAVELLQKSKTQILYRKGEVMTKQGAYSSYILFIVEGIVKKYIEIDNSKNYNLRILKSGDFVGLSAVFNESVFQYSTSTLSDTKAFLVEKEAIMELTKKNAQFGYSIFQRYFSHDSQIYQNLKILLQKQMNGRLCESLLYLNSIQNGKENIFSMLSRRDLAEFAGITTESTVKILKTFQKEGFIELHEKEIILKNIPALEDIRQRG